ncbi:MAG: SdrD B-like domain-containing protein [Armatimonadia bacterium]
MRRLVMLMVLVSLAVAPAVFALGTAASLGDTVWLETVSVNGVQDAGEPGIPNVVVTAKRYDAAGNLVYRQTQTTNSSGYYLFPVLSAGTYTVSTNVTEYDPTYDLDGVVTPNTTQAVLATGQAKRDVDFGYKLPPVGSIGDYVWLDADRDTEQDATESGIPNVTVNLLGADGAVLATTKTDAAGWYTFTGLRAGAYSVQVDYSTIAPADLELSYDLDGIGTANIAAAPLAAGENRTDLDFGYKPVLLGSIGDYVWLDADRDTEQDADEYGIPNVTVSLLDSAGAVITTTTTDANGLYTFGGLKAGDYSVQVDYSTISPADLELSYDLDGIGTANIAAASLAAGENRTDVDFGYKPVLLGSIGDYVWYDANGDTQQDAGEVGLPDVSVELYQGSDLIGTTTTNAAGLYVFGCLKAGTYTVKIVASTLPSDLTIQTYDLDGVNTANQATASLAAGEDRRDVDFGYTKGTVDERPFTTYTQGGWGAKPNGNNPGVTLHANFDTVYPDGLRLGSNHWLQFDTAQEITDFLPQGGTAGTLINNYDPPKKRTEAGVFAGQVLALRLNVDFSAAGLTRTGIGSLVIQKGPLAGTSVSDFLGLCEQVLGGDSDDLEYSLADLNDAATSINENYDNGTTDNGFLAAK